MWALAASLVDFESIGCKVCVGGQPAGLRLRNSWQVRRDGVERTAAVFLSILAMNIRS